MNWNTLLENYKTYLIIEKSLTQNSIEAYLSDVKQMTSFLEREGINIENIQADHLENYIKFKENEKASSRTKSRCISSIKSFFKYLVYDEVLEMNPSSILISPHIKRKKPTILTEKEFINLFNAIEMFKPEGKRNRAIVSVLFFCGLRVSELINLKLSDINFHKSTIKIAGENNRERIIHLEKSAKEEIKAYLNEYRCYLEIQSGYEDILFLNKRGTTISRVMIFNIIKHLASRAHIHKRVSPHTLRHSFAMNEVGKGTNLEKLKNMLGHSSIVTTEIYQVK